MEIGVMIEPQLGASYDQQLAMARAVEAAGFFGMFRSDHLLTMGGDGQPGPSDTWSVLAGLARETDRIRLGSLVTSATFRLPGPLAVSVATVDQMSGGRVELGLGAGWFEAEHSAYGIPFPPARERFERLEEQLSILTGLWSTPPGERYSFAGRHYRLDASPALPKPAQRPHPPLIVGGGGRHRTPELAARFAQEFNAPFLDPAAAGAQYRRVLGASESAGRDPATMRLSAAVTVFCGGNAAEAQNRGARGAHDHLDPAGVASGTPEQVADSLRRWQKAGATRLYLQILDLDDLDHVALLAAEVAPLLP